MLQRVGKNVFSEKQIQESRNISRKLKSNTLLETD